jgi:hypothetical protein
MSHCTVIIDGRTELDGVVTPGQKVPPAILADLVKPNGGEMQPHLMAAAAALAFAVKNDKPVQITITTLPNDGWTLTVNHFAMERAQP